MPESKTAHPTTSVGFWFLSLIVLSIPIVNIVMTLCWAYTGDDPSRRNFSRAIIYFWLLALLLCTALVTAARGHDMLEYIRHLLHLA